ncbi:MAG: 2-C-methyl-D-erythritol 4-phosphate cytidylyltransferase [Caldimonas sp.]
MTLTASSADARIHALVPCAGSGLRAGAERAKQYVVIAGRPMVAHTLAALAAVERLVLTMVLLAPGDDDFARYVALPCTERFRLARCGGTTRAATVAAGLAELADHGASPDDWVLVHDAARCLVRPAWIDALIDACRGDSVGGLLATPVADTLKREEGGRAAATLSREQVWQAQTPQMFRLGLLADALARAGPTVTDEASAVEAMGLKPLLVPAPAENFKVTRAGDFAIAAAILEARR